MLWPRPLLQLRHQPPLPPLLPPLPLKLRSLHRPPPPHHKPLLLHRLPPPHLRLLLLKTACRCRLTRPRLNVCRIELTTWKPRPTPISPSAPPRRTIFKLSYREIKL